MYNEWVSPYANREISITYENITVRNVDSYYTIMAITTNAALVTLRNLVFTNITQSNDEISLIYL